MPDAEGIADESVELVVRLIVIVRIDQAQVDRSVSAIGDNREQDVVTRFCRTVAFLDGLDAGVEHHLIALEGRRRLGGDDLTCAGRKRRHLHICPKVFRHHHIRERAEHGDQLRHVDEGGEARHRLVFAGWLQFEFGRDIAEGRSPGVELVQAALKQRLVTEIALHREHLAKRYW